MRYYAHSSLSGSTVGRYVFRVWSDSVTLVEVTAVQRRGTQEVDAPTVLSTQ